ncbi:ribosome-associated translation inhibitor RaiA [Sulfurimonas sp. HSL3-7]|uniref:ribosome hibernation-promoting factor, HPF/YfiA family n=1 Tax=Sulfonitrofixus jiaomeiensis TaxID=3131938 RepID=UPI0031F7604B
MNVSLTGRQIELTEPIKDYINASLLSMEKYNLDIISASVVVAKQERNRGVSLEYTINVAGKNTIIIKQRDDDLYAAADLATDRAQKAMRRLNDKLNDHHNESINEAKKESSNTNVINASERFEDEIVPHDLDIHKPRETGEVLEELKESNKQFEIFNDMDGKTRVLYKRSDGRYGLY